MMERCIAKYEYKHLICKGCGILFDSRTRNKNQKYCSKSCAGKNNTNVGRLKKGFPAWNKELKGYRAGYTMSENTKRKIGLANSQDKSILWKGDEVGYYALHDWVRKYKGKPLQCEDCGKEDGRIEWANRSQEYKRNLDDWIALCVPCHKRYDKGKFKRILKK